MAGIEIGTLGWGKSGRSPFWPCVVSERSNAPAAVRKQYDSNKNADKVLVLYLPASAPSYGILVSGKTFKLWGGDEQAALEGAADTAAFKDAVAEAQQRAAAGVGGAGGSAPASAQPAPTAGAMSVDPPKPAGASSRRRSAGAAAGAKAGAAAVPSGSGADNSSGVELSSSAAGAGGPTATEGSSASSGAGGGPAGAGAAAAASSKPLSAYEENMRRLALAFVGDEDGAGSEGEAAGVGGSAAARRARRRQAAAAAAAAADGAAAGGGTAAKGSDYDSESEGDRRRSKSGGGGGGKQLRRGGASAAAGNGKEGKGGRKAPAAVADDNGSDSASAGGGDSDGSDSDASGFDGARRRKSAAAKQARGGDGKGKGKERQKGSKAGAAKGGKEGPAKGGKAGKGGGTKASDKAAVESLLSKLMKGSGSGPTSMETDEPAGAASAAGIGAAGAGVGKKRRRAATESSLSGDSEGEEERRSSAAASAAGAAAATAHAKRPRVGDAEGVGNAVLAAPAEPPSIAAARAQLATLLAAVAARDPVAVQQCLDGLHSVSGPSRPGRVVQAAVGRSAGCGRGSLGMGAESYVTELVWALGGAKHTIASAARHLAAVARDLPLCSAACLPACLALTTVLLLITHFSLIQPYPPPTLLLTLLPRLRLPPLQLDVSLELLRTVDLLGAMRSVVQTSAAADPTKAWVLPPSVVEAAMACVQGTGHCEPAAEAAGAPLVPALTASGMAVDGVGGEEPPAVTTAEGVGVGSAPEGTQQQQQPAAPLPAAPGAAAPPPAPSHPHNGLVSRLAEKAKGLMVSWRAACHAQRSAPSKAAPAPAAAAPAAAPAPALASSLLRFVESSTSLNGAAGGAPALPGAAASGHAGDAAGAASRSGGADGGASGSLASSKSNGISSSSGSSSIIISSSSSGDVRSDLLRQMSACLEEPAHPLRRAGVELLTHALGTALRHSVDDAAAGASLQVTLGLRDAAARLCRCCAVGLDALLAASLPASSAAFGGPAAAGAAGRAGLAQQAATVADSDSEAVLLSLYPVRLRQLLLFVYEGAIAPPRRPGAGPSASSAAGAAGAGGGSEAATGPEAAPALAAAAVLARVCRGLVPQLKRYAMTSLSAAGAAFTAGALGPSTTSSSTLASSSSSSTSPWAAVSELPAVDAELARHVVDHVMRAFEAARPILLPAPLLMVT